MEKIKGIYKITNNLNKKCYIGSSKDIYTRWREHKRRSKLKTEWTSNIYESPLYRSFRKNGLSNFTFEIIEIVLEEKDLLERERYWYDKLNPQYNRMRPDRRPVNCGSPHTEESKNKISINNAKYWKDKKLSKEMINSIIAGNKNKRKQIVMLDKNTQEEICKFDGICNALRYLGINPNYTQGIKKCCEGKAHTSYGYSWKYID